MKMKKILKSRILLVLVTAIICISVTVYAAGGLTARNIGYSDDTAKAALDDLYKKADKQSIEIKKVCQYQSEGSFGAKGAVGAKYKCQLGAEDKDTNGVIYRYFYILTVNNDNTVDLIMDRNISSGTMNWMDAMKYFSEDVDGFSYKTKWVNVLKVDLPSAQAVADNSYNNASAGSNNSPWKAAESSSTWFCLGSHAQDSQATPFCTNSRQSNYSWLFNHIINCKQTGCSDDGNATAYGYWTRDLISNTSSAWYIGWAGYRADPISYSEGYGVRPVITLLKSNLYD